MSDRNLFGTDLEVRVFWEGVLFPYVESITIQDAPNRTTCTLQVPESHKLRPSEMVGTMLHIFYSNSRVQETNPGASGPSDWPILFQGEMAGSSSQRSVQSHQKTLRFVSHTRHFKQANFYFLNPQSINTETARSEQYTAYLGVSEVDVNVSTAGGSERTNIWESLRNAMETLNTDEGRNIAYQAVVLEILRSAKDNYPFLQYIDKKLKLSQRFAAYEDPDVRHILNLQAMSEILDNRAQSLSQNTSLMEIFNVANRMLKYNWNHISQPQLRRVAEELVEGTEGGDEKGVAEKARTAAVNIKNSILENRSSAAIPWGRVEIPENVQQARDVSASVFAEELQAAIENDRDPPQAAEDLLEEIVPKTGDSLPSSLSYAQDWAAEQVTNLLDSFNIEQSRLRNGDFINEFTVTPNMEFSHPPKCNVILPHNITSMGISRNYFKEPTRLLGRMAFMQGRQNAKTDWYIAPFEQSYYKLSGENLEKFGPAYEEYTKEFTDDIHLASLEEEDEEG